MSKIRSMNKRVPQEGGGRHRLVYDHQRARVRRAIVTRSRRRNRESL